jgi:8-oxo-dGTP pyrophosphatase MutT (NUDIX family)
MSDYIRRLRAKVGHDRLLMPSVTVIVFDERGRVLLVKHADADAWVAPGGSIEPDETPADAAVREMWEETGLLVEPTRVIGVYGGPEFLVTYTNGDQVAYLMTVFAGRVVEGEMRPDHVETLDVAYFSEAELVALNLPAWARIVLPDVFRDRHRTYFNQPTWQPPAHGDQTRMASDHMRHLRDKVGSELLVVPAVVGDVFDERGRVLMQQRVDTGSWTPPAGAIEPGESPADAVVREVWEETGLLVEPLHVTGVYGGPDFHTTREDGNQISIFSFVFQCRVIGGEPRPDGVESSDVAYFTLEKLADHPRPERWRRRVAAILAGQTATHFDPPTWKPAVVR